MENIYFLELKGSDRKEYRIIETCQARNRKATEKGPCKTRYVNKKTGEIHLRKYAKGLLAGGQPFATQRGTNDGAD